MALDGITVSGLTYELNEKILGGRVDKVSQPESDEIILSVRSLGSNYKLLLTANSSHPRIHFTETTKENPMTAPLFCMVLRKHLIGGKIIKICQPDFERILNIEIESLNELGDMSIKVLIIEIMGKHSNIILIDENGIILDSAKHISHDTSSVREVLPGKAYVLPPSKNKLNPTSANAQVFKNLVSGNPGYKIQELIFLNYTGISPIMASEICSRAGIAPDACCEILSGSQIEAAYASFTDIMDFVNNKNYDFNIIFDRNEKPIEFGCCEMTIFSGYKTLRYESVSSLLEFFYGAKDKIYRASQKTADMKKIVQGNVERCVKKRALYAKTEKDISNREELKIFGELITANIYMIEKGMTSFTTNNFYSENNEEITIRLDPNLTPSENAQRYFKKYGKDKRTHAALQEQTASNEAEVLYLEGILSALTACSDEADIEEVRDELAEQGFMKRRKINKAQRQRKSKPLHYISSDGFDIYVGKNNKQNDELTLKFAEASDFWFHTKDIPGSHVILKTNGQKVPDSSLNEAATLAAFYSKGRNGSQVPVDYTQKRNVKKPNGAKPGMVIYENNKTAYVTPDEEEIRGYKELKKNGAFQK